MLTAQNQVVIYDLHEERIIREITVGDDTSQIGFLDAKMLGRLC